MTLTELEARDKWCPFSRAFTAFENPKAYAPTCNRIAVEGNELHDERGGYPPGDPATSCIASRCMAWRWVGES